MGIKVTTKGWIEVWYIGPTEVFISRHRVETEAIEAATADAELRGGGTYELRFPRKVVEVLIIGKGDLYPPSVPGNIVAAQSGAGSITVTWSAATDTSALSHYLAQRVGSGTAYQVIASAPRTYTWTGLGVGSTYTFTISAVDVHGNTSAAGTSNAVTVTETNLPPVWTTVPSPSISQASAIGTVVVDLSGYVTDPNDDPLVVTLTGTLPAGMSYSGTTQQITVTGTLSVGTSGSITATADDESNIGLSDATTIVPIHSRALPAFGETDYDPVFRTTITRITDPPLEVFTDAVPNYNVYRRYHFYSEIQAFNANETIIMLSDAGGRAELIDASTFAVVVDNPNAFLPVGSAGLCWKWSPTQPYEMYCWCSGVQAATSIWGTRTPHSGAVLLRVTINPANWTGTAAVVADWSAYSGIYKDPSWEEISVDQSGDLWVGACARRISDGHPLVFAHNITDDTDTPTVDVWTEDAEFLLYQWIPGNVWMSPKADRVIVGWNRTSGQVYGGGTRYRGCEIFDLSMNYIKVAQPGTGHNCYAVDTDGVQWMVYLENGNWGARGIIKSQIDGATVTTVKMLDWGFQYGIHVSGLHMGAGLTTPEKNFIVLSSENENDFSLPHAALWGEVVMVYLDCTVASPHVLRLCQAKSSNNYYFGGSPFASISPSASKIIFNSNWDRNPPDTAEDQVYADAFLIDVPA